MNEMTDRRLLELAAKAAGAKQTKWIRNPSWGPDDYAFLVDFGSGLNAWVPLLDDGDALRLAVSLQITIGPENPDVIGKSLARASWRDKQCSLGDYGDGDKFAATRRAIVRAAANIGSQMK